MYIYIGGNMTTRRVTKLVYDYTKLIITCNLFICNK